MRRDADTRGRAGRSRELAIAAALVVLAAAPVRAADPPGGFIESANSTNTRAKLTPAQIQAMLPSRGVFTFPAPYSTQGIRLTNSTDCNGGDCVYPVGYSYWRNINNHVNDNYLLVFLGLAKARGGSGVNLFRYDKTTDVVTKVGPLFDATSQFNDGTTEGWYWSAKRPTTMYVNDGAKLLRYEVNSRQFETVFDAASHFGSDRTIWQTHTSDDDLVHSATLRTISTGEDLGCMVYDETSGHYSFWPKIGAYDECHVDKSGHWLLILENVDGLYDEDNRIIDLRTGVESLLLNQNGAAGHHDLGYGYQANLDEWAASAGSVKLWNYDLPLVAGSNQDILTYHLTDWNVGAGHITHTNANACAPPGQQFACYSDATRFTTPRSDEIACFRLDASLDTLVVAPVMTNLDAAGGGASDYDKRPKGNIDVTGKYFIWTSNLGGSRLDAFIVKVPSQKLVANPPSAPSEVAAVTASGKASTTLAWAAQSSDTYDISSGRISAMRSEGGVGGATCLANGLGAATYVDTRSATGPGDGYYYLIRARNACGVGTLGFAAGGIERLPVLACP
jgi:hypothetical protein